jgi:hypothetical protein
VTVAGLLLSVGAWNDWLNFGLHVAIRRRFWQPEHKRSRPNHYPFIVLLHEPWLAG